MLPITSFACQWKAPRKRKESNKPVSDVVFQKDVYGRVMRKHTLKPIEDFDSRPVEERKKATDRLPELLDKLRGKGLSISLTLDSQTRCWSESEIANLTRKSLPPQLPTKTQLKERVLEFKKSLQLPQAKIREIEFDTREQNNTSLWYSVRKYRLTASYFGLVCRRLPTTPPQSLVLQILGTSSFTSEATEWGKQNESVALKKYIQHQHASGKTGLYTCPSGFVISEDHAFLGASPDATVYDPESADPFGLAEVKCTYSCRQLTPIEACSNPSFFCALDKDGGTRLCLQKNHVYYSQVQGQMGVTKRKWCDFIVYTEKGLSVERIEFDSDFWEKELLPKLTDFYDNCLAPEIVSPVHVLGLPVRDLHLM